MLWTANASAQVALEIKDFVVTPITGSVSGKGSNDVLLSRVNTLREEAGGARRLFISDLNGPLYIFDKATRKFVVYLDFNGTEGKTGLFHRLMVKSGYGNGLNGFYLDPDYRGTASSIRRTSRIRSCPVPTFRTTRTFPR
jgi:hypothetical protein